MANDCRIYPSVCGTNALHLYEEGCIDCTPVRIEIIIPPTKLEYTDGESIDISGIQVMAYCEDGSEWGEVPFNELTFEPTVAVGGDMYERDGVKIKKITMTPFDLSLLPDRRYDYAKDLPSSTELTAARGGYLVFPGSVNGKEYYVTRYLDRYYCTPVVDYEAWNVESGIFWIEPDGYTALGATFFADEKWKHNDGSALAGGASNDSFTSTNDSFLNLSRADIAEGMTGKQDVTVTWNNEELETPLSDTYEITVQ